ncbi:MAG: SUMF1/EgtB/PvdO family nonheme iron enzyme [Tepidisphaera sp.]|nr:SUMF1/EgtB/PvdO family nonheme iron enzyme [Tepidisphaera sp.]
MGKEGQQRATKVHVAAFGKHPGWDDHIEEIGLDCDALVQVKRALYTEGIAGNIDSGAWEKLSDEHRLPGFRHVFYWRRPDGLVVGRMWSSRDGRGRTKYPMVVVAMVEGVSQGWAIEHALPRLETIESKVTQTGSAELVRLAIGEARRGLEDEAALLVAGAASTNLASPAGLVKSLIASPGLSLPTDDGKGMGLTRIMYEMEREMGAFRSSGGGTRGLTRMAGDAGGQHLRVPLCLAHKGEAASAWLELMSQNVADGVPMLVIEPLDEDFLDIIVGEVRPSSLFCVRASAKGLALTSDVPYTIEPAFRQAAEQRQAAWAAGNLRSPAPAPGAAAMAAVAAVKEVGGKKGMLVAAGVGALLLLAVLIYALSGGSSGGTKPKGDASGAQSDKPPAQAAGADTKPQTKAPEPETAAPTKAAQNQPAPAAIEPEAKPEPKPAAYAAGDIRAGWGFDAALSAVKAKLGTLETQLKEENKKPDPALREALSRAEDRANKFVKTVTLTPSNQDSVRRDMEACEGMLVQASKDIDAQLAEVYARVGAEMKAKAAQPAVTTEAMKKAWQQGVAGVDPTLGYQGARDRAAAITAGLTDAEGKILAAASAKPPTLPDADAGAIDAVSASRRDAALQAASEAVLLGDVNRQKRVVDGFLASQQAAQDELTLARRLEDLIALGELPGDNPTMTAMVTELQASPAWKDLAGPLSGVVARVRDIGNLASEQAPDKLLDVIHQARADETRLRAGEVLGAWLRLAEIGWPKTAADLPLAGKTLADEVRKTLGRIADEKARGAAIARANDAAARMWSGFVRAAGGDGAGIAAAVEAMPMFGVDQPAVDALPSWAKYNIARLKLERAVRLAEGQTGAARADAQAAAMNDFVGAVQGLDIAKSGAPAALLAAIEPLRSKGAQLDLSKLGPGSAGWKLTQSEDGLTATYSTSRGGNEHTVDFKRLAEGSGGEVSFIATTEVSVGEFADIVGAAGRWEEYRSLLPKSSEGGIDPRLGPRAWYWAGETAQGIQPCKPGAGDSSGGWVRISSTMQQKPYYPDGMTVSPPAMDSPMQYVGPVPALLAARLVGCRFPSVEEWKRALAGDGPTPNPNLRDATWKKEYEHIKQFTGLSPQWPASGIFLPAGQAPISAPNDGLPAVTTDDGVLWFRPVNEKTTTTFHDLIGNVSEYVSDGALVLEGVAPTREAVEAALEKGEKLRVIGGSALSPQGQATNEPQPVNFPQSRRGYSDVGFRLAFSAPRAAGAAGVGERLQSALGSSGYLPAQK